MGAEGFCNTYLVSSKGSTGGALLRSRLFSLPFLSLLLLLLLFAAEKDRETLARLTRACCYCKAQLRR